MVIARSMGLAAACLGAVVIALIAPETAHAAASLGTLDQMLQQFQTQSNGWGASLRSLALNSFYILAVIDIAVAAVGWAFRGGDLGDFLGSLVGEIMFLGIFLALLENSVSWSQDIISSFRQGAASTGASAVTPSAVFAAGVSVAKEVMDVSILCHPIDFVAFMIAAIVIVICFAGVAATMIVALVESYLVIQAGVLLMAFGGSRWTKDIALAHKYAVAVGAKLMMLQFLANLGTSLQPNGRLDLTPTTAPQCWSLLPVLSSCSRLRKSYPRPFMRLVGGASLASGPP